MSDFRAFGWLLDVIVAPPHHMKASCDECVRRTRHPGSCCSSMKRCNHNTLLMQDALSFATMALSLDWRHHTPLDPDSLILIRRLGASSPLWLWQLPFATALGLHVPE